MLRYSLTLRCLFLVGCTTLLFRCDPAPATAPADTPIEELGPNAAMIRLPVDDGVVDTVNVAKIAFAETEYAFGSIDEGGTVRHDFAFTNTGTVPLVIAKARSTCGCTVPSYPKAPIAPGESGVIEVVFDTKNKSGRQRKPVIITANTYPAETTVYVNGRVDKK